MKKQQDRINRSYKRIFNRIQTNAERRSILFDLTFAQTMKIISGSCYYCGAPPVLRSPTRNYIPVLFNGIDRVDNDIGYSVSNCVPCCPTCNHMKSNISCFRFIKQVTAIVAHLAVYGITELELIRVEKIRRKR